MQENERELVKRAQQGDRRAFGKLIQKYQDKILYLAYDLVGNYDDAQDIAQNAFLRAMNGIHAFKAQSSFSTWLYRIVVNLSIDYKRSVKRKKQLSIDEPTSDDMEQSYKEILNENDKLPDEITELKDFEYHVQRIVETLPQNQRVAFVLRHYHDMDMPEIAKVLNCKTGTVRSHLFRAISKLRTSLKEFERS
ncbi:sigma-70 family RNA polymerase sigma factor [candidate division KSB1 bacterium]|nr:sigma-70 family RNA polymerase sigma factor [candidate division KSB1 bacterium]